MKYHSIIISLLCSMALAVPAGKSGSSAGKAGSSAGNTGATTGRTGTTGDTTPATMPDFMTVDKCKKLCDSTKAKKPLFYGQCSAEADEACEGNADFPQLKGYHTLSMILQKGTKTAIQMQKEYKEQFKPWTQKAVKIAGAAFWPSCSQAISDLAEGEIYVLFPESKKVLNNGVLNWKEAGARDQSIWEVHEYPRICENKQVTKLIHLAANDKNFKEDLTEKLEADRKAGCPKAGKIPTEKDLPESVTKTTAGKTTKQ